MAPVFKFSPTDRVQTTLSAKRSPTKKVWAPLTVVAGGEEERDKEPEFDPAAPPPFSIVDVRAAIPKHCWVRDPWRSLSYVARDIVVVVALAVGSAYMDSWVVWPLYWFAQGTMFWALFLIGHDCGHQSFSDSTTLNSFVGHLVHTFVLVPYHGWRISHRTHHQNHGHVENDESWHPPTEKQYKEMDPLAKKFRFTFPFPMFVYPFYLWWRGPGKRSSHFDPNSDLFRTNERIEVMISTLCWAVMVSIQIGLTVIMGPLIMLKLYVVPYWICVMWLDLVTYLQHHGHEQKLPWYRGKEWSYLRGSLTTVDHDYGWINNIHHDVGTHVIHHLFPQIPHYHLVEATKAAKHVLGKYYREPKKSGILPIHLIGNLMRSLSRDHYVSETGDVVYYQTDPKVFGASKKRGKWEVARRLLDH